RLEQILEVVKSQTGYEVLGNTAMLRSTGPIAVDAENMPLIDFLNLIFKHQPLGYRFVDKTIMLERKSEPDASTRHVVSGPLETANAGAAPLQLEVRGRV